MKAIKNLFKFSSKKKPAITLIPFTSKIESGLGLCIDHLDNMGLIENVYSAGGNQSEVEQLEKQITSGTLTAKSVSQIRNASTIATAIKNIIGCLSPPLLPLAYQSKVVDSNADLEALLLNVPSPQHSILLKFLTHLCDIADSSPSESISFKDLALCVGTELFGPLDSSKADSSHGRSSSADEESAMSRVVAVERLLAFRSHVIHGRPVASFYAKSNALSINTQVRNAPNSAATTPMKTPASTASTTNQNEVIVESILDRSVKVSFPKTKKTDSEDVIVALRAEYEKLVRGVLDNFDDVVNVGFKEKLAVIMFNSINSAVKRSHQLTQLLAPDGFKVSYMGAGEMIVTVADISPKKPASSILPPSYPSDAPVPEHRTSELEAEAPEHKPYHAGHAVIQRDVSEAVATTPNKQEGAPAAPISSRTSHSTEEDAPHSKWASATRSQTNAEHSSIKIDVPHRSTENPMESPSWAVKRGSLKESNTEEGFTADTALNASKSSSDQQAMHLTTHISNSTHTMDRTWQQSQHSGASVVEIDDMNNDVLPWSENDNLKIENFDDSQSVADENTTEGRDVSTAPTAESLTTRAISIKTLAPKKIQVVSSPSKQELTNKSDLHSDLGDMDGSEMHGLPRDRAGNTSTSGIRYATAQHPVVETTNPPPPPQSQKQQQQHIGSVSNLNNSLADEPSELLVRGSADESLASDGSSLLGTSIEMHQQQPSRTKIVVVSRSAASLSMSTPSEQDQDSSSLQTSVNNVSDQSSSVYMKPDSDPSFDEHQHHQQQQLDPYNYGNNYSLQQSSSSRRKIPAHSLSSSASSYNPNTYGSTTDPYSSSIPVRAAREDKLTTQSTPLPKLNSRKSSPSKTLQQTLPRSTSPRSRFSLHNESEILTLMQSRIQMLEAEARVREHERMEAEAEVRRSEMLWSAEIAMLTNRNKALENDLLMYNEDIRQMKVLLAQKEGELASLKAAQSFSSLAENELKLRAERSAMTAVIAQKKLTALLDSQLESVDSIAKHSQSELIELRHDYEQALSVAIDWQVKCRAADLEIARLTRLLGIQQSVPVNEMRKASRSEPTDYEDEGQQDQQSSAGGRADRETDEEDQRHGATRHDSDSASSRRLSSRDNETAALKEAAKSETENYLQQFGPISKLYDELSNFPATYRVEEPPSGPNTSVIRLSSQSNRVLRQLTSDLGKSYNDNSSCSREQQRQSVNLNTSTAYHDERDHRYEQSSQPSQQHQQPQQSQYQQQEEQEQPGFTSYPPEAPEQEEYANDKSYVDGGSFMGARTNDYSYHNTSKSLEHLAPFSNAMGNDTSYAINDLSSDLYRIRKRLNELNGSSNQRYHGSNSSGSNSRGQYNVHDQRQQMRAGSTDSGSVDMIGRKIYQPTFTRESQRDLLFKQGAIKDYSLATDTDELLERINARYPSLSPASLLASSHARASHPSRSSAELGDGPKQPAYKSDWYSRNIR